MPGISNFFQICLKKFASKNRDFFKLPEKIEILLTRIHDPQISNQIDAAYLCLVQTRLDWPFRRAKSSPSKVRWPGYVHLYKQHHLFIYSNIA